MGQPKPNGFSMPVCAGHSARNILSGCQSCSRKLTQEYHGQASGSALREQNERSEPPACQDCKQITPKEYRDATSADHLDDMHPLRMRPYSQADVLYNNTSLAGPATGVDSLGLFDDVLIPDALDPSNAPIAITQVTVFVAFSPGIGNFSLWAAGANDDTSPMGTPFLLSSQTVPSSLPFQGPLTFGDGINPIGIVDVNSTAVPGFELLYLGLTSDNALGESWDWANGPSLNLPTAYMRTTPVPSPGSYFVYPLNGFPFTDDSLYLSVQGNPVAGNASPEPSTLCLAGLCCAWLSIVRFRYVQSGSKRESIG